MRLASIRTVLRFFRHFSANNGRIQFLHACGNFYYIIDLEDAWKVISSRCGVTREEFDRLIPIFERDDGLSFYIENEQELYKDGRDKLILINKDYLCIPNDECEIEQFIDCMENDKPYDGPSPLIEDWERFYALAKEQAGKKLYIPDDVLQYAVDDYYEDTAQARAMLKYLEGKTEDPVLALTAIVDVINDVNIPMGQGVQKALEVLDYTPNNMKDAQKCADLFTDLSNNTRMPSNRGFKPSELMRPGLPKSISFGPGIQKAIASGEMDGEELKKAVMAQDWPTGLKNSIVGEVNKALKPGEERWVGGTLYKGDKIRPNDPCPCGSGKKYKKCCGKRTQ